jgi:hypothetical protein
MSEQVFDFLNLPEEDFQNLLTSESLNFKNFENFNPDENRRKPINSYFGGKVKKEKVPEDYSAEKDR